MSPTPHFNFQTKQGPRVLVSNIRHIAFYGCLEIIRTRNFTILTMYAKIFEQFTAAFHFFQIHKVNRSLDVGPSEKVQYLTLDFLKSFSLWTIRKKNQRDFKSSLKQERHPYKGSTIKYNSINTEPSLKY